MIRIGAFFVGIAFLVAVLWSFGVDAWTAATTDEEHGPEYEYHEEPGPLHLTSDGPLGHWDEAQLQRGYQVYKEVCSACHSLKQVAFRDLAALGYSDAQIKNIAAEWQVPGIDPNTGEATTVPGTPVDYFPSPYPNDVAAAAANNNAIPPDLSLITKARHGGAPYVYSLLVGYQVPPAELFEEYPDFTIGETQHYNPWYKSLALAMAPPLTSDGQVTYAPGNPDPTIEQMAKDVTAFLVWTAEPTLVKRKQTGYAVLLFVLFATILAYFAKKEIWRDAKPASRKDDEGEAA